jgi:DNA-binding LacI/PurR family transcriptional regulator
VSDTKHRLTIYEIAKLAGVSHSTVSRVLNNHPNVKPVVRERVQQIMDQHKFVPHMAARTLATNRTRTICLFIPHSAEAVFNSAFFSVTFQGITETCAEKGYFVVMTAVPRTMDQNFMLSALRGQKFDGIILTGNDIDDPFLPVLIKEDLPLVRVGTHPYLDQLSWVDGTNREGTYAAVTHLIGLGHQRIATITGPLQDGGALGRRDGYKQALLESGIAVNSEYIREGDWSQESGYRQMLDLLVCSPRPTAVFAASDMMAMGAMYALNEQGLSVPSDMAMVGFDNLPQAAFTNPPLTTVDSPRYQIGAAAAELLIAHIEQKEHKAQHIVFPTPLVVRRSCGAYGGAGPTSS